MTALGGGVQPGRRRALFHDVFRTGGAGNPAGWDVDPSGRRFVLVRDGGVSSERKVDVLVNWFDQPRSAVGRDVRP